MMIATPAAPGMRGFDCNASVSAAAARAMAAAGYTFALRYLPRVTPRISDLTPTELAALLAAGLAVMPVQHVESETSWTPTEEKGRIYGATAARVCATALGLPKGVTVWLDLEGVADGVESAAIIAFCRAWYAEVAAAGYQPGIYVGWHARLTPAQLYALPFTRYWAAYNLNADEYPAKRGICMKQGTAKLGDVPRGVAFGIDTNEIKADALGGVPMLCCGAPAITQAAA